VKSQVNQNLFFFELFFSLLDDVKRMAYCPECGGKMKYISMTKRYVCQSCGLSVSHQELIELRQQLRPNLESDLDEKKRSRKEYLKWWLGKK
jgi:tRNA(Ile2) C34 agmatinyltransferase TiaS